jgi:hypothetical protein
MQCKIFAQTISKQNLEIVCREQHCSIQKADSILRNCAYIHFDTLVHDFDTIPEGPDGIYSFEYINIGAIPLIITNVHISCCSFPHWDKETLSFGQKSKITVFITTQGRPFSFAKSVTVWSNSYNKNDFLTVKGFVSEK